jgi:hypothetical protein
MIVDLIIEYILLKNDRLSWEQTVAESQKCAAKPHRHPWRTREVPSLRPRLGSLAFQFEGMIIVSSSILLPPPRRSIALAGMQPVMALLWRTSVDSSFLRGLRK